MQYLFCFIPILLVSYFFFSVFFHDYKMSKSLENIPDDLLQQRKNRKNYQPYTPEIYPENIKYIKDTMENRAILKLKFGTIPFNDNCQQYSYIKFDTSNNTWKPSFDFEWLYRNSPP